MKRTGSALIYVIIVVFSLTSMVLVSARLASSTQAEFDNQYRSARFKAMADGAVAEAIADAHKQTLSTAATRTTTYADGSVSTRATPSSRLPRAYDLEITATLDGVAYKQARTVGNRATPNPLYYGLWSAADHSDAGYATTVDGSLYVGGNATFAGPLTVSDDVLVRGTSTISAPAVSGYSSTGVRIQAMPPIVAANYTGLGTALSSNKVSDITFGAPDAGGLYAIMVRTGNLTMNGGVISGQGTVFVSGNLNVDGNYNYADSNARVVFIVGGQVRVNAAVASVVGSFISAGRLTLSPATLTVNRGNFGTGDRIDRAGVVTITQDNVILESRDTAVRHRIPGIWAP